MVRAVDLEAAEHDHLMALRRELVSTLVNDWGEKKSVVARDLGKSYMVVTQDLKAVEEA